MASPKPGQVPAASPPRAWGLQYGVSHPALRSAGIRPEKRRAPAAGVTLIELLIVIAILGILSAAGFSVISGSTSGAALEEGLRRIAADLSYAQAVSVASGSARAVAFSPGTDTYVLLEGTSPMQHPITRRSYAVRLAEDFRGSGLSIPDCSFAGGDTLRFLGSGTPEAGGWVIVRSGAAQGTLEVSSSTGRISWRVQ